MTWILQDGQFHTAANLMGHIRKLIKDEDFASHMTEVEGAAWFSFVDVNWFLGNTKVANYQNLVEGMLKNSHSLETRMSIKLHYLYSHLESFPKILVI